jgi:hypothetical protein
MKKEVIIAGIALLIIAGLYLSKSNPVAINKKVSIAPNAGFVPDSYSTNNMTLIDESKYITDKDGTKIYTGPLV